LGPEHRDARLRQGVVSESPSSGASAARGAAEDAAEALGLAQAEPGRAWALATHALEGADGDLLASSLAEQALGLAAKELNRLDEAVRHLQQAVRMGRRLGKTTRSAEARLSLAFVLAHKGDMRAALREADRAGEGLHGHQAARLQMRRAAVLQRLGRFDEALDGYRQALTAFRRSGDQLWEARLLCNRGVVHAYRGGFRAAERDLRRSEQLYLSLGQSLAAAEVRHNLGFVAARRGDIPNALAHYDEAEELIRRHRITNPVALLDRSELLLSVRLVSEAREAAERAVSELAHGHMASRLAEGRLLLAQAALLQEDLQTARAAAQQAQRDFTRQRRPGWAALARYAALCADWRGGERSQATLSRARRAAGELAKAGWALPALDARLMAAKIALSLGKLDQARTELSHAGKVAPTCPVELRARAWHAEALLRLAGGDRRGADAAARAGMRALHRHRATLGATELRAHVAGHADELATLGLQLAVEAGRPERVLGWAERWRAGALHLRPALPPDDTEQAADLVLLRDVVAQIDAAALDGRDTRRLLLRQANLERAIQRRSRHAQAKAGSGAEPQVTVDTLADALGERALVEMVRLRDELLAVVVVDGRARLHRLGDPAEILSELEALRFALRRISHGRGSPASLTAADRLAAACARRLDTLLLGPLRADVGVRDLVIIPTGALHALPWSVLPSCAGRAVSVAPSALLWFQARTRLTQAPARGRVVVAGCAGPPQAIIEASEVARHYERALLLTGDAATVAAVMHALDGADLAHLACHGRFRADNPLFSCLELSDGPLTVYDLERIRRAPPLLILSACDSGLSVVKPGDELMGLAAALFSVGTATLVASVVPVPDTATRQLMLALHERLRAGVAPATALAHAQADAAARFRAGQACGFVCLGAG
jgi:CHAT domain-containing protein/tetratricopeptide (TPR) repeat protein